ncbi:CopG family transcriptional regulator [Thiohalorhabdus methylotrophus]|uniref:CopG family transcriptional regulator n=1 Tax=Thiohalorhabdus methylotrophus TaxID=3242694 RepID=A0ABV4TY50_9GAMM
MGQVTIYLDDETEKRLRKAAESAGVPVSRWIGRLIQEETRTQWPESVRKLAGIWPDFPEAGELRKEQGTDTPREAL